jgi:hypothetical protein
MTVLGDVRNVCTDVRNTRNIRNIKKVTGAQDDGLFGGKLKTSD